MDNNTALSAPQPRRKAYSYLRFSTPEQSKGDSFRRQMAMAVEYATKHDLDLDLELTFHDVGVSAYRGKNADAGRLACFVEAVRSGQVPQGSVLLVEQLDRISRLTPLRGLDVLRGIISEGVGLVTLNDGKLYTQESLETLPLDLIVSILTFTRANEESETKAKRLRSAWETKRAELKDGKPITARLPAWLRLSKDRRSIELIPDRVEGVQRIFSMALEGVGQHKIAATFNREELQPWGRGKLWHRSYIAKVLSNPAVLGRFQPHKLEYDGHKKGRRALEPVEGYFPAIISEEVFREAQALREVHGAPQRGRHAHAPVTNILAGLAVCPKCAATMTRVAKGKRSRPAYVCSRAKGGAGCEYKSVRCDRVEAALLRGLPERLRELEGAEGSSPGLQGELEAAEARVGFLNARAASLADTLSYKFSRAVSDRLDAVEADLEAARGAVRSLQERVASVSGQTVQARVKKALEALQPQSGEPVPAEVNLALRRIFKRAVIDWTAGKVDLEWTHGGLCSVPYSTFTKWPGGGWSWQDEEETNDD